MTHTDDDPPNADRIPSGDIWEMKAARKGTGHPTSHTDCSG